MGVNTIAFVTAKKEVMFNLMPKLIADLNKWQRKLLDTECEKKGRIRTHFLFEDNKKEIENWSNGISDINTYDFNSFSIYFRVNGEKRKLFITYTCSNDYSDAYKGDKIIFSLGNWGMSKEIMMVVVESVKDFGRVFFVGNDYDEEFKELTFETDLSNQTK